MHKKHRRTLELKSPKELKSQIREYISKSDEAEFIHRLHIILLKIDQKEMGCETIAQLFGNSPRTISNWINKLNECGDTKSLRDKKKPGRKPRLNKEQMASIKEVLQKPPRQVALLPIYGTGKACRFTSKNPMI